MPKARKYEAQVKAGIAFLNRKKRGRAWMKKIDLSVLRLTDCKRCVLGQLYGEFAKGLDRLFPFGPGGCIREMGFALHPLNANNFEYAALTREWKRQLKEALCESA